MGSADYFPGVKEKNMIYTVTFNPSIDYIIAVDDFKVGMMNRTAFELIRISHRVLKLGRLR